MNRAEQIIAEKGAVGAIMDMRLGVTCRYCIYTSESCHGDCSYGVRKYFEEEAND